MQRKDFQDRVLTTLTDYLGELVGQAARSSKIAAFAAANPELAMPVPDFTEDAWTALRTAGKLPASRAGVPFSPRKDSVGRPVPNLCLKVPTGGGKTLLAAESVSRILDRWQGRQAGVVLWICPNEAIFSQTRKALRNREHPYRQLLDKASGGRTRILEKDDPLHRADVDANLCVMLLMLQSANRETKESLRLFRDRGNVHGFFPVIDDRDAHARWLQDVPNLDYYSDVTLHWHVVKDSLGNALRAVRPIVVLDEGHKGYSKLAMETVYDFNPSFVIELSATPVDRDRDAPPVYSNWLCDVRGTDLEKEDMIKLPINVFVRADQDWRACLTQSLEKLNALQADADRLHAECARYIRPICLVQVERTGKEQRDGKHVHSQDALGHLLTLGLRADQIAIKSADQDDLKARAHEDLSSATNPVRFIITSRALQEGWDCPFAYVLCALAPTASRNAMTQLIGRILRQPDTEKTGIAGLDQCHVLCVHAQSKTITDGIKKGLEQDGMHDLADHVRDTSGGGGSGSGGPAPTTLRRSKGNEVLKVYLPVVHWLGDSKTRELDYEADLLSRTDVLGLDMKPLAKRLAKGDRLSSGASLRVELSDDEHVIHVHDQGGGAETPSFDPVHVCRAISDLVPNGWQARQLVGVLALALADEGVLPEKLGSLTGLLVDELRKELVQELDALAEALFRQDIASGLIQFSLRTDARNYMVPENFDAILAKPLRGLVREDGKAVERALFSPTTDDGINKLERSVACYLDAKEATRWWFRNVARSQYGLQGWRKHRVYPDLIVSLSDKDGRERLLVLETKGEHLAGNHDTTYKQGLLDLLSERFSGLQRVGGMELVGDGYDLDCALVLETEWETTIPVLLRA